MVIRAGADDVTSRAQSAPASNSGSDSLGAVNGRALLPALVAVGLLALVGCPRRGGPGGDAGSVCGAAGSCNGGKEQGCNEHVCCQDYQGGFTAAEAQSSCAMIGGAYSSAPCRSQDLVGSCVLYQGTAAQQTVRYYTGYVTPPDHSPGVDSATANCDGISGWWAAPQTAVSNGPCGLTSSSSGGSGGGASGSGSGGGGGPSTFSCNAMGTNLHCYEYKNVPPGELSVLRSSCKGVQGTGCPVGGLAGCCTTSHTPGGMSMETCYYAPLQSGSVARGCSRMGTFSSTP